MPIWQAPSLLFAVMGIIIIFIMIVVYLISQKYKAPEIIIFGEIAVVLVLFTAGNFIIQNIEQMAKVNKMKTEFILSASHQLKAPLSEINWEIELLLVKNGAGLTENHLEIIKRIARANQRMARLVNDLLDVTRIESGNLFLVRERFNLSEIVEKIIENNMAVARAHNIEISLAKPADPLVVCLDRRRIGVAIDNLISNAVRYIRKKGRIKVAICRKGDQVVFSVKDNGIGIPIKQQENIFEKFFRGENALRYQISGTGLGLFITKGIIEGSGGKIWLKSEENKGSEFYFSLPLATNQ